MTSITPQSPVAATALEPAALSTGLRVATMIFAVLASLGLIVTLILLFMTLATVGSEDFGWYFAFSTVASIVNAVPAVVVLVLGLVGRRARSSSRAPLTGIVIGAVVLVILTAQFVFLAIV